MDLDHFKSINDNYGHITGDEVLITFADIIRKHMTDDDVAGRFGGEEFIVILHQADLEKAYSIAEDIRMELSKQTITKDEHSVNVTVSIGVAGYQQKYGTNSLLFLDDADNAMYAAKKQGRNRTIKAQ